MILVRFQLEVQKMNIMNIINIENVRRIEGFNNKVEIKSDYKYSDKISTVVILNEDDINNDNSTIKLRGVVISALLIPKRNKYTFADTNVGKLLKPCLTEKSIISYY